MASLKSYLETYSTSLKEFNGLITSKPTQLRAERSKTIHSYFHTTVLPAMATTEPKVFKAIVRSLSQVCRNKSLDLEDTIEQIDAILKGNSSLVSDTSKPTIDTETSKPCSPEVPESPCNAIVEKKKTNNKAKMFGQESSDIQRVKGGKGDASLTPFKTPIGGMGGERHRTTHLIISIKKEPMYMKETLDRALRVSIECIDELRSMGIKQIGLIVPSPINPDCELQPFAGSLVYDAIQELHYLRFGLFTDDTVEKFKRMIIARLITSVATIEPHKVNHRDNTSKNILKKGGVSNL